MSFYDGYTILQNLKTFKVKKAGKSLNRYDKEALQIMYT